MSRRMRVTWSLALISFVGGPCVQRAHGAPLPTIEWGTYYGDGGFESETYLARSDSGHLLLMGYSELGDGTLGTPGTHLPIPADTRNPFLAKFDAAGKRVWATYYGGASLDRPGGVAVGPAGDIFLVGRTFSQDGISTPGAYQVAPSGGFFDGFLARLDPDGKRVWGTYIGGANSDTLWGVAVDAAGDVVVCGRSDSPGLATPGAHKTVLGGLDVYLAKFDASGQRLWATYYGGSADESLCSVAVSGTDIYITGTTTSTDGIATPGVYKPQSGTLEEAFLARFDGSGARQWGTYFGGQFDDDGGGLAVDGSGAVYLVGLTRSPNGIATPGAYQAELDGDLDVYLARFTDVGALVWATYFGGELGESSLSVAAGESGDVYITGMTSSSTGIATPNAHKQFTNGITEPFVARFGGDGSLRWASYMGGDDGEELTRIVAAPGDVLYLAGSTMSTDGIATPGAFQPALAEHDDLFLMRLAQNGGEPCVEATECGNGLCVDGVCCDAPCGDGTEDCQVCSAALGAVKDGTCSPAPAAALCRPATSECDVAEVCSGDSLSCPNDQLAPNGAACADGMCVDGACEPAVTSSGGETSDTGGADPSTSTSGPDTTGTTAADTSGAATGGETTGGSDAPTTDGEPTSGEPGGTSTGGGTSGSSSGSDDSGSATSPDMSSPDAGCTCRTNGGSPGAGWLLAAILWAAGARRRSRAHCCFSTQ